MIDPDDTITQAAQKMKSSDAGVLPVVRGDEVVGTITDRDIVLRELRRPFGQKTASEQ